MNKEDIAFQKMALALEATRELQEQDDTLDELKAAAFEVLLLNPGSEHNDWVQLLIEQYATELTDEYGTNPADVYASLDDLWESPYFDKNSGLEYDYKDWAEAFATDAAVQMYYNLTERINESKNE